MRNYDFFTLEGAAEGDADPAVGLFAGEEEENEHVPDELDDNPRVEQMVDAIIDAYREHVKEQTGQEV